MTDEVKTNEKERNVTFLKLDTSEEIIGEVKKYTADTVRLSNPVYIRISYDNDGQTNLVLFENACNLVEGNELLIERSHVVFEAAARKDIIKLYDKYVVDMKDEDDQVEAIAKVAAEPDGKGYTKEQLLAYFEKSSSNTSTH